MIAEILVALLNSTDARAVAIRAKLATFAGLHAIFTSWPGEDAPYPCIRINERAAGSGFSGTRDSVGHELLADVVLYDNKNLSAAFLLQTGRAIHELIERNPLTQATAFGMQCITCLADPPRPAPDSDQFPGYLIQVRVRVLDVSA